ncbi:MAG: zinc-binding alcohol dehydrogenase family protein [Pseudomonadota bacterium]
MKAAVYYQRGGPEVLSYEEVPDPVCGPKEIRIETKAISVEGGDVLNRGYGELPRSPFIVGYTAAGVIVEVGSEVSNLTVGQRVATIGGDGSHAEQRVVPAFACWALPDDVPFDQGVCISVTCGTAHEGLFEFGHLKSGETVLIQGGAGGVGVAAIQLAKEAGATVYATASSNERLAKLTEYGMDEGINYVEQNLVEEVMRLTEGRGVNVVLDPVGGPVLEQSIACASHRGRIVSVGTASRDFNKVNMHGLAPGNKSLIGVFLGAEMATPRVHGMIASLAEKMAAGTLRMPIDRTFPLKEAASAHAYIESRQAVGRVILVP